MAYKPLLQNLDSTALFSTTTIHVNFDFPYIQPVIGRPPIESMLTLPALKVLSLSGDNAANISMLQQARKKFI